MQKIDSQEKNLKQLLQNTKYTIHYYQRGYMWKMKQVSDLLDDLTGEFLGSYNPNDKREDVKNYESYFMGPIVLSGKDNAIIDGQQRFTTLTLLLIYLNNRLRELGQHHDKVVQMIFSESYGTEAFNINIPEREECMKAIFSGQDFDASEYSDSVKNLYSAYHDIVELFPSEDIGDDILLNFCDWLTEKVLFIEIVATAEQDAYKIFVTMNDRGLSLTPTEMLKGYILSEIKDSKKRGELDTIWKTTVQSLTKNDPKGDETLIKAWLRAQYAETIRETKAGAENQDFEEIGVSFHNWVRSQKDKLGLHSEKDYELFVRNFAEFAKVSQIIREAGNKFADETKYVFYSSQLNFTSYAQVLLAPICSGDSREIITQKINLTAQFLEFFIMTRITSGRSTHFDAVKSYVFKVIKAIRRLRVDALKDKLSELCEELKYEPEKILPSFGLNKTNKRYVKHFLARITSFIEEQSGSANHYHEYMDANTKNPYEIEHIIANHYDWFAGKYANQAEFVNRRNNIGALLLLPKKINASLSDYLYEEKLLKYCSSDGNIYTASLGEVTYQNNPGFKKFKKENNLPFEHYERFGKKEISERVRLLARLFNLIWNPSMFN